MPGSVTVAHDTLDVGVKVRILAGQLPEMQDVSDRSPAFSLGMSRHSTDVAEAVFPNQGTHKGEALKDIPLDYLVWAEAKMIRLPESFRAKITEYLARPEHAAEADRLRQKLERGENPEARVVFTLPTGNVVELTLSKRITEAELNQIFAAITGLAPLSLFKN